MRNLNYEHSITEAVREAHTRLKAIQVKKIEVPTRFWYYQQGYTFSHAVEPNCCFNHWLGLPMKAGREHPIYDYEMEVYDALFKHRYLAINKFTGAGMTEMLLRAPLHMMLTKNLPYKQFAIITGTRMEFAVQLIQQRLKPMIVRKHRELIRYDKRDTLMLHNGYYFRAYPTDHLDALRGQDDLQFILLDEGAMFHPNVQEELFAVVERYKPKTRPFIVWNSTPKGAVGAFYTLYTDAVKALNDYYPIEINYKQGLGLIIDREEVAKMKLQWGRLFDQEFNNKFLAPLGAILPTDINIVAGKAVEL